MLKNIILKYTLLIFSIFGSLLILEISLRVAGFKPWTFHGIAHEKIFKYDKELGWISSVGSYELLEVDNSKNEKININILKNGNRLTGQNKSAKNIVLVGGSFTQGWNVSDSKTFAYKLNQKINDKNVLNFGQSGYGGIQSLLLLERLITETKNIEMVMYGYIDHHDYRNVARGEWLKTLLKYSSRGHISPPKLPYGFLKDNELFIHSPVGYLQLPFREKSSLVTLIEEEYMKITTKNRKKIQTQVTEKIIFKMHDLSQKNNIHFIFVNLSGDISKLKNFLLQNNIDFVDCNLKLTKEYLLKNDHHPNENGHEFYYNCILKKILN